MSRGRAWRRLARDRAGSTAAEFALTVPIVLMLLFGTVELGRLFIANAGLQNAIGEAARTATLFPRRSDAEIQAQLAAKRFGLDPAQMATPVTVYGTTQGNDYVDISVQYDLKIKFIFLDGPAITLVETRRAYRP